MNRASTLEPSNKRSYGLIHNLKIIYNKFYNGEKSILYSLILTYEAVVSRRNYLILLSPPHHLKSCIKLHKTTYKTTYETPNV
jgi:hypothetical protein